MKLYVVRHGQSLANSLRQHVARAAAFRRELEQSGHSTVVALCHEGALRSLYNYIKGLPAGELIRCKNGGVCLFALENGTWTVETREPEA